MPSRKSGRPSPSAVPRASRPPCSEFMLQRVMAPPSSACHRASIFLLPLEPERKFPTPAVAQGRAARCLIKYRSIPGTQLPRSFPIFLLSSGVAVHANIRACDLR